MPQKRRSTRTPADPSVNWDEGALTAALEWAGFADVTVEAVETELETRIQPAALDRWFGTAAPGERADGGRPSYRQRLAQSLSGEELATVETLYRGQLTGQAVPWRSVTAFVVGRRQDDPPDRRH